MNFIQCKSANISISNSTISNAHFFQFQRRPPSEAHEAWLGKTNAPVPIRTRFSPHNDRADAIQPRLQDDTRLLRTERTVLRQLRARQFPEFELPRSHTRRRLRPLTGVQRQRVLELLLLSEAR